jgi:mannitol/fructose-specific phosphotransferase system IIA component (Ntr-type)
MLPPLAEHRSDLSILFREAKQLAKQVGADLHVYLAGEAGDALLARIDAAKPGCPVTHHRAATWADVRGQLFADHKEEDLILLPLERRNTVLWTPTLDVLPDQLAARFPQANLLVVYPALAENESKAGPLEGPAEAEGNDPHYRGIDLPDGIGAEGALGVMTAEVLADDPRMAAEARGLLWESARLNPVELLPGIVLLHAHCGQRQAPLILIGKGRVAWPFPDPAQAPGVLLALLSPRGHAPEAHLHTLAKLARAFHDPANAARIQAAPSAAAIAEILKA